MRTALHRVDGHSELGVKVVADPETLRRAAAGGVAPAPAAGEGVAYLALQRRRRQVDSQAHELGAKVATAIHARLTGLATGAVRGAPQPRELTREAGWMVLNGAYLVEAASVEGFAAEVERLGARFAAAGVRVAMTGPWAPYNFTRIDGDSGMGAGA